MPLAGSTSLMKPKNYMSARAMLALIILPLWSLGFVGCAKPVPVTFDNLCKKENNNLSISIEGYLTTGTSVLCSSRDGKRTCGLELLDTPDGTNKVNAYVEEGTGKSQMEPLPKSYSKDDLRLHDNEGKVFGPQDRVRVIGIAKSDGDGANASYVICYVNVVKIERP